MVIRDESDTFRSQIQKFINGKREDKSEGRDLTSLKRSWKEDEKDGLSDLQGHTLMII